MTEVGLRRRAAPAAALLLVLAVGGWLRFHGIRDTSPFLWDDAIHHLEAVFLRDAVHFAQQSVDRKLAEAGGGGDLWTWEGERERFRKEVGGIAPRFGRPGHMVLVATAMAIVGPVPWAGPLVSAIAGTASIAVLFLLVRSAHHDRANAAWIAVAAAAWLAVDPLHVRLSREGLAEADGVLGMLLTFWIYLRARRTGAGLGWCAIAGLMAGIAFTLQTRNFLAVGFLVAWELAPGSLAAGRTPTARLKRIAIILAAAALPLALCELPYYLLLLIGRSHGVVPQVRDYAMQVIGIFANHHFAKRDYIHASALANLKSYPLLFRALAGTWWPQLVVLAAAVKLARDAKRTTRERRASALLALTWLFGSVVFLSVTAPLGRYASFFVPAMAWVVASTAPFGSPRRDPVRAANGAGDHGQTPPRRLFSRGLGFVWIAGLALVLIVHARSAASEINIVHPGYRAAVEWMTAHGGIRHVSTQPFVSQVWAGENARARTGEDEVARFPGDRQTLEALVASGHRYLLVDLIRYYFLGAFAPAGELLHSIESHCDPTATFANTWAARPEYLFEFNYDIETTERRIAEATMDRTGVVDVYDLASCTLAEN